jgi:hypothetical protein
MALVALAAPTHNLVDTTFTATATNVPAASGTALTGNTGFTVPWVPGLVIQIASGATGAGVVTAVNPSGSNAVVTLAASANVLYLVPEEFANATTGLVQVNVTTVTTASAAAFIMPGGVAAINEASTGAKHNPFQSNPTAGDF